MKLFLLFVAAVFCIVNGQYSQEEIAQKWKEYKVKFGKQYSDSTEDNFRQQIFLRNLQNVDEHNRKYDQGLVTYTKGINQFSDLTSDEIKKYTNGIKRPNN